MSSPARALLFLLSEQASDRCTGLGTRKPLNLVVLRRWLLGLRFAERLICQTRVRRPSNRPPSARSRESLRAVGGRSWQHRRRPGTPENRRSPVQGGGAWWGPSDRIRRVVAERLEAVRRCSECPTGLSRACHVLRGHSVRTGSPSDHFIRSGPRQWHRSLCGRNKFRYRRRS